MRRAPAHRKSAQLRFRSLRFGESRVSRYRSREDEKGDLTNLKNNFRFSSKVELVWNLDDGINDSHTVHEKLNDLQRPHDPLLEEGLTFTKDALTKTIDDVLPYQFSTEQVLVVVVTDGVPSKDQNPCGSSEISRVFHGQGVRTAVVSIEEGNVFDLSPFQCLYYPYSTEVSFVSVESYRDLLGYQMHPIIMDAAFPINCDSLVSCDFSFLDAISSIS